MSKVSAEAKVNAQRRRILLKGRISQNRYPIHPWEDDGCGEPVGTSFGGHGILTKEQYERGMALSRKMAEMDAW